MSRAWRTSQHVAGTVWQGDDSGRRQTQLRNVAQRTRHWTRVASTLALRTRQARASNGKHRAPASTGREEADSETCRWNEGVELRISGKSRMEGMIGGAEGAEGACVSTTPPVTALDPLPPLMLW